MSDAPRDSAFSFAHASMVVAVLSLMTAMYQGYLNTQNAERLAHDAATRESLRSCRDAAESFFDAKLRIERLFLMAKAGQRSSETGDRVFEARSSTWKFAAVATHLANFSIPDAHERYTRITQTLEALIAQSLTASEMPNFDEVQVRFNDLNADCIRATK